jgi:uncharacterized repeat protein (TIGR01451 family)
MKRVLLVFAVVAGLALGVALWHATEELVPVSAPGILETAGADVAFTGGVSRTVLRVGQTVRFWVTVHNRGATAMRDVRLLTNELPGYRLLSGCWCPQEGPTCLPPAATAAAPLTAAHQWSFRDCERLVPDLATGQTLTVWGDLVADVSHPPRDSVPRGSLGPGQSGDIAGRDPT